MMIDWVVCFLHRWVLQQQLSFPLVCWRGARCLPRAGWSLHPSLLASATVRAKHKTNLSEWVVKTIMEQTMRFWHSLSLIYFSVVSCLHRRQTNLCFQCNTYSLCLNHIVCVISISGLWGRFFSLFLSWVICDSLYRWLKNYNNWNY